jgi:dihydrofolate reductase
MRGSYCKPVSIIVAVDEGGGFGKNGKIPWRFPKDSQHFKDVTSGGICIMGKRTYNEIAEKREGQTLLPNRDSYVLSRSAGFNPVGAMKGKGLRQVIENIPTDDHRKIFVIGGEKLFVEALSWCNKVYLTVIKREYDCDRHFPVKFLSENYKIDSGEELKNMYFVNYILK